MNSPCLLKSQEIYTYPMVYQFPSLLLIMKPKTIPFSPGISFATIITFKSHNLSNTKIGPILEERDEKVVVIGPFDTSRCEVKGYKLFL